MLGWITSWWGSDLASGPARNAPNNGKNIKQLFEQRPQQVIIVTAEVITQTRDGLRPTVINGVPPISQKPAIMQEFDTIFSQGVRAYLTIKRQQRPTDPQTPDTQPTPPRSQIMSQLLTPSEDDSSFSSNSDAEDWTSDDELTPNTDITQTSTPTPVNIPIETEVEAEAAPEAYASKVLEAIAEAAVEASALESAEIVDVALESDEWTGYDEQMDKLETELEQWFEQAVAVVETRIDAIEAEFEQAVSAVEAEMDAIEEQFEQAVTAAELEAEQLEHELDGIEEHGMDEAIYILEQKFEDEIRKFEEEVEAEALSQAESTETDSEAYTSTDTDEDSSFYNNDSTDEDENTDAILTV